MLSGGKAGLVLADAVVSGGKHIPASVASFLGRFKAVETHVAAKAELINFVFRVRLQQWWWGGVCDASPTASLPPPLSRRAAPGVTLSARRRRTRALTST